VKARVNNERDLNATHLTRLKKDEITRGNKQRPNYYGYPVDTPTGHIAATP